MQTAVRSYFTTGVALMGAGVVAIAPISATPPDVQVPNLRSASDSVALAASFDPLTPWLTVFNNSKTNVAGLANSWLAAPAPVLQQVIANQIGYLSQLPDFQTILGEVRANLEAGVTAPFAADPASLDPTHAALFELLGLLGIPAELAPLLDFSTSYLSGVLLGLVGPVVSPVLALAAAVQVIGANLTAANPDPVAALNTLVNIPADVTNAFLNGGQTLNLTPVLTALGVDLGGLIPGLEVGVGVTFGGLLSPGGSIFNALDITAGPLDFPGQGPGAIGSLIGLSKAIAKAIGWDGTGNPLAPPVPPAALRGPDVSTAAINELPVAFSDAKVTTLTLPGAEAPISPAAEKIDQADTSGEDGGAAVVAGNVGVTEDSVEVAPTVPKVKDSPFFKPGKFGESATKPGARAGAALKSIGDGITKAVNDIGDGIKKALGVKKKAPSSADGTPAASGGAGSSGADGGGEG